FPSSNASISTYGRLHSGVFSAICFLGFFPFSFSTNFPSLTLSQEGGRSPYKLLITPPTLGSALQSTSPSCRQIAGTCPLSRLWHQTASYPSRRIQSERICGYSREWLAAIAFAVPQISPNYLSGTSFFNPASSFLLCCRRA